MLEERILFFYQANFFADPRWSPLPSPCRWSLTADKRALLRVRCVIFHLPSLLPEEWEQIRALHGMKPRRQVWVAFSLESAAHFRGLDDPDFMRIFDYEMSYRQEADIWAPYVAPDLDRQLAESEAAADQDLCCAFISSGWDRSGRRALLRDMVDRMPIDSYGKYLRNRELADDTGWGTKMRVISGYRYTLAFENSIAPDYVTEKFFQPLVAGSIPVYLGAPNVDEFSPGDNAYIDTSAFPDAGALVDYLLTADHRVHHQWRRQPLRQALRDKIARRQADPFDALCDLLDARHKGVPSGEPTSSAAGERF